MIKSCQETSTETSHRTLLLNMRRTDQLQCSKSETPSDKNMICSVKFLQLYPMLCKIFTKERKRGKPLSKVSFHTTRIMSSNSLVSRAETCLARQHLISNRTDYKLRKKLANQKRLHMSLRLCGIRIERDIVH